MSPNTEDSVQEVAGPAKAESSGLCTVRTYPDPMTIDPSVIRSVAVSAEDLLAALEADARGDSDTVLRVTPPFSGRMRARLHVVQGESAAETLHIPPRSLVEETAPSYPTPDETADELRVDDDEQYSVERHRDYHEQRVAEWRETLLDCVVSSVILAGVDHEVAVSVLGP